VFPYAVSSYNNHIFGLSFLIIFLIIVTVGFVFEFARGALEIKSKQTGYLVPSDLKVKERQSSNLYLHYGIQKRLYSTKRVTKEVDTDKRSSSDDF
jgi:hypothetical protein